MLFHNTQKRKTKRHSIAYLQNIVENIQLDNSLTADHVVYKADI